MNDEVEAIERLVSDPIYKRLMDMRGTFDLFDVVGGLAENASSRVLRFLLDSEESHGLGTKFYHTLLHHIYCETRNGQVRLSLQDLLECSAATTQCEVEWCTHGEQKRRLDILIRASLTDGKLAAVVGIENKHGAAELRDQLASYQRAIVQRFPEVYSVLFFLAPTQRVPETEGNSASCPCIPCSYRSVVAALAEIEPEIDGDVRLLVRSLHHHFQRSLLGTDPMNEEISRLVHKLYANEKHRLAIRHIIENVPTFSVLADPVVDAVLAKFPDDPFDVDYYPTTKTRLQEVKLRPETLKSHTESMGFTLTYLLHAGRRGRSPDAGETVKVQLMASCSSPQAPAHVRAMGLVEQLPHTKSELMPWGHWLALWAGEEYQLQDLAENDIKNCTKLFVDAIEATLPPLTNAILNTSLD